MQLSPETIYQYLHKRQIIDEDAVVKGNFMVHPVNTRNNIMKIVLNVDNSLFVKQTKSDIVSDGLFQREIQANYFIKNNKEFASIATCVPLLLDHDDENNVIITELLYDAKNLYEHYMLTKNFDLNLAREQASILYKCHTIPEKETDISMFPKLLPWVLQLDKHEAHQFFTNNPASLEIIKLIKDNQLLLSELVKLANSWQYTHLIHGDIKWINFLATANENGFAQKLIDWELADIGDPLWDVAGIMQSYITTWLLGFDNNKPHSQELPEYMKFYDIKNMQPSAQAFLYQYANLHNYSETESSAFFIRVIQFTAARIIQTSVEGITYNTKIEANNMRCIQLAFNVLKDPRHALAELFNIKL